MAWLWLRILGRYGRAERWLSNQHMSDAYMLRLWAREVRQ